MKRVVKFRMKAAEKWHHIFICAVFAIKMREIWIMTMTEERESEFATHGGHGTTFSGG